MTSYKNTAIGNQPNRAAAVRAAIFVWTQLYLERLWLYFRERLDEAWRRKIVGSFDFAVTPCGRFRLRSGRQTINIFYQSEAQLPAQFVVAMANEIRYNAMQ
jgi:hypothetical protein